MTKSELKKQILKDTRLFDSFFIFVTLWHGDSHEYEDAVYLDVICYEGSPKENQISNSNKEYFGYKYGNVLEDNEQNTNKIRKEQNKLVEYLAQQGFTVISSEQNI